MKFIAFFIYLRRVFDLHYMLTQMRKTLKNKSHLAHFSIRINEESGHCSRHLLIMNIHFVKGIILQKLQGHIVPFINLHTDSYISTKIPHASGNQSL